MCQAKRNIIQLQLIKSKSFINSSSIWWWSQSHIPASKDFTAVIPRTAKPQKNCSSWNVAVQFQKKIAHMNRTHGFSRDFYMISPALAPQSSISPSSLRIHFSVSSTCPRFSGVHAKFNASSSSLPKGKGIGMDLVCKREGIFRRQQASDCKPTHVANLRLRTWLFGFQKFGIWFIDILPSTMLPLYRSKALDPFLFQTWRKRQTNQPRNEAKAEVRYGKVGPLTRHLEERRFRLHREVASETNLSNVSSNCMEHIMLICICISNTTPQLSY